MHIKKKKPQVEIIMFTGERDGGGEIVILCRGGENQPPGFRCHTACAAFLSSNADIPPALNFTAH